MYISRTIEKKLKKLTNYFPVISLSGPSQSGKTTLLKTIFSDYKYINLELPNLREIAENDPISLIEDSSDKIFIDEVQKVPNLLSYIQHYVDSSDKKIIISGSQNLLLYDKISQSLAGRVGVMTLLPFSIGELKKQFDLNENELIYKGFYPRIYEKSIPAEMFYPSYINTYLEKAIADLISIKNVTEFRRFLRLLAGRIGQNLNYQSLASDVGVSPNTVKSWISILEKSYIIYLLKPYHSNFSSRFIKMPKPYFIDVGLAVNLLGINDESQIINHPLIGSLFENLIIIEKLKNLYNKHLNDNLYFWRDSKNHEVDLIEENQNKLDLIEIKYGKTFTKSYVKNLNYFEKNSSLNVLKKIIYRGDDLKYESTNIMNWRNL